MAFDMGEPPLEVAELLLSASACAFTDATRLLLVSRWWAALARSDCTFRILAVKVARGAKLHFEPSEEPADVCWRDVCRRLFEARGTFCSTFEDRVIAAHSAPQQFSVTVGCRFRPPGGPAAEEECAREVCLPIHQRLKLIRDSYGCSLAEARRKLWSSEGAEPVNHYLDAEVAVERKAADVCGKENQLANGAHNAAEEEAEAQSGIQLTTKAGLIAQHQGRTIVCAPGLGIRAFEFSHSWDDQVKQRDVYATVSPTVRGLLNGRSSCILAYGQTGAGKSFTMFGSGHSTAEVLETCAATGQLKPGAGAGVAPRVLLELVGALSARSALGVHAKLKLAAVEVFGASVTDLLHEGADLGAWHGVAVAATSAGHADEEITSVAHAMELLDKAEQAKRRAATRMNERSSRAHSLLLLTLEQQVEGEGLVRSSLCLADLGGCEKVKRSGAVGERLQEAIYINKGLLALKAVVTALNQEQREPRRPRHVPFADDKLTLLLKPSLSGGAQTLVFVSARPEAEHAVETMQALRFGEACAQVDVGAVAAPDRAAAFALAALDAQVAEIEAQIRAKERFETVVQRQVDPRAGLCDASGGAAYLTDVSVYEQKVSRIVGAEKEREQLEKVLAARRALIGE
uniref:Kinesin motor domain-containing protein n=1 Tax=Calcidiscus leptoporus TaxID=127549 RepID=A0A7S0JIH4_9EUKA